MKYLLKINWQFLSDQNSIAMYYKVIYYVHIGQTTIRHALFSSQITSKFSCRCCNAKHKSNDEKYIILL